MKYHQQLLLLDCTPNNVKRTLKRRVLVEKKIKKVCQYGDCPRLTHKYKNISPSCDESILSPAKSYFIKTGGRCFCLTLSKVVTSVHTALAYLTPLSFSYLPATIQSQKYQNFLLYVWDQMNRESRYILPEAATAG